MEQILLASHKNLNPSDRNALIARELAGILIDERGALDRNGVDRALTYLEGDLLPPDAHMRDVLAQVDNRLLAISAPYRNPVAEQLIRETVGGEVSDATARRAVLSAWLTYLRQNVGSCFATAPAILVQREQPDLFLRDMGDLLATGKLSRTFGGVEYSVPLTPKWGVQGNPLLKAWEFTLASFTETKAGFSKWNLFKSLGLDPKVPGGLGEALAAHLQEELDKVNGELRTLRARYEIAASAADALQMRYRSATDEEGRWIRAEYTSKVDDVNQFAQEIRLHEGSAEKLANSLGRGIQQIIDLFPAYFQEVYDPELHEVGSVPFEDSPAGFRLIYKHGRTNPALWTPIHDGDEYIQSLSDFFIATERLVDVDPTPLLQHIRSEGFVKGTPWAYISGGSMETLVSCYFGREGGLTKKERAIESETDLLLFLLETLKELPVNKISDLMLMEAPRHAFLLTPNVEPFREGWLNGENTYTWIREYVIRPGEEFVANFRLPQKEVKELLDQIAQRIPKRLRINFTHTFRELPKGALSPRQFREFVVSALSYQAWMRKEGAKFLPISEIDQILFSHVQPPVLIFADTNWDDDRFAFVVNPGTEKLELFRVDSTGKRGTPMATWKHWLDGSTHETWVIYTRPSEYCF